LVSDEGRVAEEGGRGGGASRRGLERARVGKRDTWVLGNDKNKRGLHVLKKVVAKEDGGERGYLSLAPISFSAMLDTGPRSPLTMAAALWAASRATLEPRERRTEPTTASASAESVNHGNRLTLTQWLGGGALSASSSFTSASGSFLFITVRAGGGCMAGRERGVVGAGGLPLCGTHELLLCLLTTDMGLLFGLLLAGIGSILFYKKRQINKRSKSFYKTAQSSKSDGATSQIYTRTQC
jgi:hypothetical protein